MKFVQINILWCTYVQYFSHRFLTYWYSYGALTSNVILGPIPSTTRARNSHIQPITVYQAVHVVCWVLSEYGDIWSNPQLDKSEEITNMMMYCFYWQTKCIMHFFAWPYPALSCGVVSSWIGLLLVLLILIHCVCTAIYSSARDHKVSGSAKHKIRTAIIGQQYAIDCSMTSMAW